MCGLRPPALRLDDGWHSGVVETRVWSVRSRRAHRPAPARRDGQTADGRPGHTHIGIPRGQVAGARVQGPAPAPDGGPARSAEAPLRAAPRSVVLSS